MVLNMYWIMLIFIHGFVCTRSLANGQLFAALHGSCLNSAQCFGLAICEKHRCQCPAGYSEVDYACVEMAPSETESEASLSSPIATDDHFLQTTGFSFPPTQPLQSHVVATETDHLPFGALLLSSPEPGPRRTAVQHASPKAVTAQSFYSPLLVAFGRTEKAPIPVHVTKSSMDKLFRGTENFLDFRSSPVYGPSVTSSSLFHYAYPGQFCERDTVCLGYSFCWYGKCTCPRDFISYGSRCNPVTDALHSVSQLPSHELVPASALDHAPGPAQGPASGPAPIAGLGLGPGPVPVPGSESVKDPIPWYISAMLPPSVLNGCLPGEILIDYSCKPLSVIADYPIGIACRNDRNCYGGALCIYSLCMCLHGVWRMGACVGNVITTPTLAYNTGSMARMDLDPNSVQGQLSVQPVRGPQQSVTTIRPRTLVAVGPACLSSQECQANMGLAAFCHQGICVCKEAAYEKAGEYTCVMKRKARLTKPIKNKKRGKSGRGKDQQRGVQVHMSPALKRPKRQKN